MRDPRAERLAKILVGYSTEVQEGEVVSIDGESGAAPLLLAVYEEVLKAGAQPIMNVSLEGQAASYYRHASEAQLDRWHGFHRYVRTNRDGRSLLSALPALVLSAPGSKKGDAGASPIQV